MNWLSSRIGRSLLLGLLACAAAVSVVRGAQNGIRTSQDFQWSGTHLIIQHIDPWADAVAGDPLHIIALTQDPNYLPILYVFFAPLGLLDRVPAQIVWVGCNILFAIVSAWIAARFFGFGRYGIAATVCALLAATPTRMTIGNGQQGLFVLLFWSLGLLTLRLTDARAAIAGTSYFKYNFAPPVAIYLWLRAGMRAVLFSLAPAAIGLILIWLWFTGGRDLHQLAWFAVAPFKLARRGYFPSGGGANLMDVLEVPMYAAHLTRYFVEPFTLCISLVICFAVMFRAVRSSASVQNHMALLGVLSFSLFKHHTYDSGVLLFTLCYLARLRHHSAAQIGLLLLAYIWYAERALDQLFPSMIAWSFIPQCAMLLAIAWIIFRLQPIEATIFAPAEPLSTRPAPTATTSKSGL